MLSAWAGALGKVILKKNIFFCRVLVRALGKITVNGRHATAENILPSAAPSTRQFFFILPSAWIKSTRQRPFAEKNFAERTLPSATASLPTVKAVASGRENTVNKVEKEEEYAKGYTG